MTLDEYQIKAKEFAVYEIQYLAFRRQLMQLD